MSSPAAAATTVAHLPRIFPILAGVALLVVANHEAPGVIQAVLLLVVLYALLTNVPRAQQLIATPIGVLRRGYGYNPGAGSGPGGNKVL